MFEKYLIGNLESNAPWFVLTDVVVDPLTRVYDDIKFGNRYVRKEAGFALRNISVKGVITCDQGMSTMEYRIRSLSSLLNSVNKIEKWVSSTESGTYTKYAEIDFNFVNGMQITRDKNPAQLAEVTFHGVSYDRLWKLPITNSKVNQITSTGLVATNILDYNGRINVPCLSVREMTFSITPELSQGASWSFVIAEERNTDSPIVEIVQRSDMFQQNTLSYNVSMEYIQGMRDSTDTMDVSKCVELSEGKTLTGKYVDFYYSQTSRGVPDERFTGTVSISGYVMEE